MKWTGESYEVEVLPNWKVTLKTSKEGLAAYQAFQLASALIQAGHYIEKNRPHKAT